jgi:uncharacterized protein DUF4360
MPRFNVAPSLLTTRPAAAHRAARLRRGALIAAASLVSLACGAPEDGDLGFGASALLAAAVDATPVIVDPDTLQATIAAISTEGVLCPPGSVGIALADSGTAATVILSQSIGGVQTAGCVLSYTLDVPEGLALGMPTTILRGVVLGSANLERRYSFEGAGASNAFVELTPEDFVIADRAEGIESRSCAGSRRVTYKVDVTAQVLDADTFFQLDSVDVDTTFRFGTDWRLCDPSQQLVVAAGESGDFCDGPNARACADGLVCEKNTNSDEGSCSEP